MKGIVLCGGTGTRLFPLTKIFNKHLIPVYNDFMVMYPLRTLINAGLTDIMIVAGKGFAGDFLELLGDGSEFGINLSYVVQQKPAGIAHALRLCKRFSNKDNIAVILGDNVFEDKFDFSNFREGSRVYLKRIQDAQRFGVARLKTDIVSIYKDRESKIIEIIEKPDITKVDNGLIDRSGYGYAVTGLYIYDNSVFDKINCLMPSTRNELEITDLNNIYLKEGRMHYQIIEGFWSDMGTMESLYRASSFARSKEIDSKKH